MRINLSLLEGTAGNRERLSGAELWRQGKVLRIARAEPDEPNYEVLVGDDRESAETVQLRLEQGDDGPWLDSWSCSCSHGDECCTHAVAAAFALQHNLEQTLRRGDRSGKGTWRSILTGRGAGLASADRTSWICYDLNLTTVSGDLHVGVVRRKRSLSDRGKRSAGAVVGWSPTAVGHFGYRTADDAAQNPRRI